MPLPWHRTFIYCTALSGTDGIAIHEWDGEHLYSFFVPNYSCAEMYGGPFGYGGGSISAVKG